MRLHVYVVLLKCNMHRTTVWRRKRRGVLSPEAEERSHRISLGKTLHHRKINKVLKACCQLIHFRAFKGYGELSSKAFANLRSVLLGFKLPINLLAVACCDLCGDPRRRQCASPRTGSLKSVSLNRACPTRHVPELSRPLVHYWRKHGSYPIARAVIKFSIQSAIDLEGANIPASPSVAEQTHAAEAKKLFGLSRSEKEQLEKITAGISDAERMWLWEQAAKVIAVCLDQSEPETRKNFESMFCLINGEIIDKQRSTRLEIDL